MKFLALAAALALAGSVAAAPQGTPSETDHNVCGNAGMYCCNKVIKKVQSDQTGTEQHGILTDLLNLGNIQDISIFDQCSKLGVAAVIGLQDLLNDQCKQTTACCQDTESNAYGAIALALPCIPISSLV